MSLKDREDPIASPDMTVSLENQMDDCSPLSECSERRVEEDDTKRVRFMGIHHLGEEGDHEPWTSPYRPDYRTDDELSSEELRVRLSKMRNKLTQTQIDLSGEKALRKKKEKNLIKIAKELVRRAAETDEKSAEIVKLKEQVEGMEGTMRSAVESAASHHREAIDAIEKCKQACDRYEERIFQLSSEHEESTASLRKQLYFWKRETERLRKRKVLSPDRIISLSTNGESRIIGASVWSLNMLWLLLPILVVVAGVAFASIFGDTMCSPIRPGVRFSILDNTVAVAPWWAPTGLEDGCFALLCAGRRRIRFEWMHGKLVANEMIVNSGDENTLWNRRAHSVEHVRNLILLRDRGDQILETMESPWKL